MNIDQYLKKGKINFKKEYKILLKEWKKSNKMNLKLIGINDYVLKFIHEQANKNTFKNLSKKDIRELNTIIKLLQS